MDAGLSPPKAGEALAAYARLGVDFNNATRGYELMGLPKASAENFTLSDDLYVLDGKGAESINLVEPASATRLAASRGKMLKTLSTFVDRTPLGLPRVAADKASTVVVDEVNKFLK